MSPRTLSLFYTGWLLLCLLLPALAQAGIEAFVDRNELAEGETLQLTLRLDGTQGTQPDLAPLRKDFDILGTGQSSQFTVINGSMSSRVDYVVSLSPRRAGRLTIPALEAGGQTTHPIDIQVRAAGAASAPDSAQADAFLEVQVEPEQVHVQQELVYTVRLYHAVPLYDADLSDPAVPNAIVERMGDDRGYDAYRGGRRYHVIERRYRIFPQRSGSLEIPSVALDGKIAGGAPSLNDPFFGNSILSPMLQTGRPVRLRSRKVDVRVEPQPADFHGKTWLPARALSIGEQWSQDPPSFRVGEPITRTLTLRAEGLTASQIPDIGTGDLPGFRSYPDQARTDTQTHGGETIATRVQKIALVPTRSGDLELPAVRVHWWSTRSRHEEIAELPARTVHVLLAVAGAPSPPAAAQIPAPASVHPNAPTQRPPTSAAASPHRPGAWPWVAAGLACAWLLTLVWMLYSRGHGRKRSAEPADTSAGERLGAAARHVLDACGRDDAPGARAALLAWARARWPEDPPLSLGALAGRLSEPALQHQIDHLDQALYRSGSTVWHGSALRDAFRGWARLRPNSRPHDSRCDSPLSALAPLRLNAGNE